MPNLRGKTWTTTTPANVEDAQYWEDHLISDTAAAKAASSVQSVNSITPDQNGNVEIGNAGHTIQDDDGNDMPKQDILQFVNADVTNDTVNEKTVVDCKGAKGDAATITVGTVTTLPAGSDATVTNSGTSSDAVFNFGIPKGADGEGAVDSVNGYTGVVVLDASDVGALPDSTTIPTKTSDLDNDSGFVTANEVEQTLRDAEVIEGKNKLPITLDILKRDNTTGTWSGNTYTKNGVTFTFTFDENGYLEKANINGTNSASDQFSVAFNSALPIKAGSYVFNGCPNGGGYSSYWIQWRNVTDSSNVGDDIGNGIDYTFTADKTCLFRVYIAANATVSNKDFYPMLRDASETDSTFEPYYIPLKDSKFDRAEQRVLGAYNLLKLDDSNLRGTPSGLAYEYTSTGIRLYSTSAATFLFVSYWLKNLPKNTEVTLKFSLSITSGSGRIFISDRVNPVVTVFERDYTSNGTYEVKFNTGNYTQLAINFYCTTSGTTGDVTYSDVCISTDPNPKYAPYAMTNRELTEKVTPDKTTFATVKGTASVNAIVKTGNIVVADLRTNGVTTAAWETIASIPTGYRPANNVWFVANDMTGGTLIRCALNSDGTVTCPSAISNKEIYIHAFWTII